MRGNLKNVGGLILAIMFVLSLPAFADSKNLAPGFAAMPKGSSLVLIQPDLELSSISAGGVQEPRADWTEAAVKHVNKSIASSMSGRGLSIRNLSEDDADELSEISSLHAAIARSIALHHMEAGNLSLPTKNGKLDWSLGDAVAPLREKTGSDYALFVWMRDSYASNERKATMFLLALVGIGLQGGSQQGYASLVDLRTGQVLWFNWLARLSGDLREEASATETTAALLRDFPGSR